MTTTAIEALRADRDALLRICEGLSDDDWAAPSGCAGWSVQDVIGHVDALFWLVVDPSVLPDAAGLSTERAQEIYVDERRSWSVPRLVDDYRSVSVKAIDQMAELSAQDFEVPLGDLGTYHVSLLPNAFSFDHFTHIRADLFAPRGPLATEPPPTDAMRLDPALDWIAAALAQQNPRLFEELEGAVDLVVEGPAARTIRVGPGEPAAEIRSDGLAFVRWITQRGTWEDLGVKASGPEEILTTARLFHVF
jgi:uncharacterized protein (TIGR03083 family)